MLKSTELKKTIDLLKQKIRNLQAEEKYDDAAQEAKKLEDATNELNAELAIEAADTAVTAGAGIARKAPEDKKLANRVFNKLVLGRELNEEEREYYNAAGTPGQVEATPEKGGYIVPEEQISTLLEFRRDFTALKSFCDIRNVSRESGKMPTIGEENGKLVAFDELNDINTDDFDFGQLTFSVKSYGDIIPVSNELLADTDIDLMGVIGRRFARKSINTENEKILAVLPSKATAIGDYKGIITALNKTLDPAISASAAIFTNQDGYDYLDQLTDAQGRPLLTTSLADAGVMLFKGRPLRVVKNSLLATTKNAIPFYVGSMGNAVAFFDRQQVSVAASTDAGFTKNQVLIRAVERFDVTAEDTEAMVFLTYTPATA